MFRYIWRAVLRAIQRFLSNRPSNNYEQIVFRGVRDMATEFGGTA